MNNFVYDIPTKIFFGEGQLKKLPKLVEPFGKKNTVSLWWRQY